MFQGAPCGIGILIKILIDNKVKVIWLYDLKLSLFICLSLCQ